MRHLLFDISDKTIRDFFDQIDIDDVGTIETKLLIQDVEFSKRILNTLNDQTTDNNNNKNNNNDEVVLDGNDFKANNNNNDDDLKINMQAISSFGGSPSNTVNTPTTIGLIGSPSGGYEDTEKNEIIMKLQGELEESKTWRQEYGDTAIAENKELHEQIKVYRDGESDLRQEIEDIKLKLEEKTNLYTNITNQYELLKIENNSLTQEFDKLTNKYNNKIIEYEETINELNNIKLELTNTNERILELNRLNEEFVSQHSQMKIELNNAMKEKNDVLLEEEAIANEFENVNEIDNKRIEELELQVKELREELQEKKLELSNQSIFVGSSKPVSARNQTIRWDMGQRTSRGSKLNLFSGNSNNSNASGIGGNSLSTGGITGFKPNNNNSGGLADLLSDPNDMIGGIGGSGSMESVDPFEENIRREIEEELKIEFEKKLNEIILEEKEIMEDDFKNNILPNMRIDIKKEIRNETLTILSTIMSKQMKRVEKEQNSLRKVVSLCVWYIRYIFDWLEP